MGLLDDLVNQLSNRDPAGQRPARSDAASGPNMSTILMALAPVALAMLQRSGREAAPARGTNAGGGFGDLLGGLLGGSSGGLGGLLGQFQRAGFGVQTQSWVGTGENVALPPGALEQVFGRDQLSQVARRVGLSEDDTSRGLAQLLPEMVDRMTPRGEVPDDDALDASFDDLARRLKLG
jgi:uncharacterized protein YidB (DUF937 family)